MAGPRRAKKRRCSTADSVRRWCVLHGNESKARCELAGCTAGAKIDARVAVLVRLSIAFLFELASIAQDEKIKALEQELSGYAGACIRARAKAPSICRYKEKMKRTKGPALKTLRQRAMAVLKRKKMYEQQRDQLSGQACRLLLMVRR